jgi:hypothetical protein
MLDYHCWIEINGNVVDWDTKSNTLKTYLTLCASINLRTNKYTVEYVEWGEIDSITADKIEKIESDINKDLDSIKNDKKVWKMVKDKSGKCNTRALLLKRKNPSARIVYGSLGLRDDKGNIWWEFGNGSKDSSDKALHVLNKK